MDEVKTGKKKWGDDRMIGDEYKPLTAWRGVCSQRKFE
jgi:hypothetical protein